MKQTTSVAFSRLATSSARLGQLVRAGRRQQHPRLRQRVGRELLDDRLPQQARLGPARLRQRVIARSVRPDDHHDRHERQRVQLGERQRDPDRRPGSTPERHDRDLAPQLAQARVERREDAVDRDRADDADRVERRQRLQVVEEQQHHRRHARRDDRADPRRAEAVELLEEPPAARRRGSSRTGCSSAR